MRWGGRMRLDWFDSVCPLSGATRIPNKLPPNCGSIWMFVRSHSKKMGGTLSHRETPHRIILIIIILLKWAALEGEGEEDNRVDNIPEISNHGPKPDPELSLSHPRTLHLKDESATSSSHLLLSLALEDFVVNPRQGHFLHTLNNLILSTDWLIFHSSRIISIEFSQSINFSLNHFSQLFAEIHLHSECHIHCGFFPNYCLQIDLAIGSASNRDRWWLWTVLCVGVTRWWWQPTANNIRIGRQIIIIIEHHLAADSMHMYIRTSRSIFVNFSGSEKRVLSSSNWNFYWKIVILSYTYIFASNSESPTIWSAALSRRAREAPCYLPFSESLMYQ